MNMRLSQGTSTWLMIIEFYFYLHYSFLSMFNINSNFYNIAYLFLIIIKLIFKLAILNTFPKN